MNKKNKNKNRSKPTNPTPAAEKPIEPIQIIEDTTTIIIVDEKPFNKESDSAIETKSEQIQHIDEGNELETESPKKPKRSKGKKKKQEDTNLENIKLSSVEDTGPVPPPVLDSEVKLIDVNTAQPTETKGEEENITANVRKKKNKKKQNEQQKLEESAQEIVKEKVKNDDNKTDSLTEPELITPEVSELDMKQTKKKNKKKKNRHDSEKSDRADEVVTCTAAFQDLIKTTKCESDTKSEKNKDTTKDSGEEDKNLDSSVKIETLQELIQSVLLPEEELKQFKDDAIPHDRIDESKSKKKSKKDKKVPQPKKDNEKTNLSEDQTTQQKSNKQAKEQIIQQPPLVISSEIIQESPAVSGITMQELSHSTVEGSECTLQDTILKPKAKIAKPVEKKRKGKAGSFESHDYKTEDENILVEPEVKEKVLEANKLTVNVSSSVELPSENVENVSDLSISQKHSTDEPSFSLADKCSEKLISTNIKNVPVEAPIESFFKLGDVSTVMKSNEEETESSVTSSDPILLKSEEPENITNKPSLPLEVPDEKDILLDPYKTVEKKKKKHPRKLDITREKTPENKTIATPEPAKVQEETLSIQSDIPVTVAEATGVNTPGDVEISSLKTDENDGTSDATPDFIHHPLATSQQFSDKNNNMIIRDITSVDEKLSLPLLIPNEPIIQDSGETPEPLAEKISIESPSVSVIKEKSVTSEPEKTDLKSKMMEVSQDMEELRLSIERSLAELTSMERSEENVEKTMEVIEDTKSGTLKLETPVLDNSSSLLKDILSGETTTLDENVSESIRQKSPGRLDVHIESKQPTPGVHETLPQSEILQEKHMEIPTKEQSGDHKKDDISETQPQVPSRKDNKGKGKGKRKGKQEAQSQQTTTVTETTVSTSSESTTKEVKKDEKEKSQQKSQSSDSNKSKGKQQGMLPENGFNNSEEVPNDPASNIVDLSFEPIENFEDALTSSVDDVNKTFEMIASEVNNTPEFTLQNPQINVIAPVEDTDPAKPKQSPVSPPKNLLGHPDIPVPSNRTDYKKEKNKPPNMRQAKVKIKDAVDVEKAEKSKQSKESQTENKIKPTSNKNVLESFSYMTNDNAEYVYKYSFRKVFLQSLCHLCRKELIQRVPCQFCSLVFYCSQKHKDEDWPQHQSLCFSVCTIAHLKDQKHIYADAKNITGQNYRLLRMQMIISCEKVLKRKLVAWEQETLLYPRVCADVACREWRQDKLADCEGCGQISYCSESPDHLPASHQRWCRSYSLYQRLVHHQQTKGRLEPKLPSKLMSEGYRIPEKINEVLAALYDEKIDMTDMEYAALSQLATAPLTTTFAYQLATLGHANGLSKKSTLVVHLVGAELQFEADVLFKWELFLMHLRPSLQELRIVLISPDLNPSNLPLDLLGKVNLCESCKTQNRRVLFSFQDKKSYYEYWCSDEFYSPDIVCAFNPSIQRSSMYNGKDTWPTAVSCILKLKTPFIVSSYSINELNRDIARIKECSELSGVHFKIISEPKSNPFASVRPDRNFITDDEIPLLFKNYCFSVLCGV